jgi:hypothetical protein
MTLRRPWPTVNVNATWYNTSGPKGRLVCAGLVWRPRAQSIGYQRPRRTKAANGQARWNEPAFSTGPGSAEQGLRRGPIYRTTRPGRRCRAASLTASGITARSREAGQAAAEPAFPQIPLSNYDCVQYRQVYGHARSCGSLDVSGASRRRSLVRMVLAAPPRIARSRFARSKQCCGGWPPAAGHAGDQSAEQA